MANTISLSIDISQDDEAFVNDDTVYTSPARATIGVFISVYKMSSESTQSPVASVGNQVNPKLDTEWTFQISTDGWYQIPYVAIPDYSTLVSYAQYAAAIDPTTKLVYRSLGGSNLNNALTNPTYWEPITEPATLAFNVATATASPNIDSAIYSRILTPKTDRLYGDTAVTVAKECCGDCELPENVDMMELVFAIREGALISEERMEYAEGEKMIRRLDEFTGTC